MASTSLCEGSVMRRNFVPTYGSFQSRCNYFLSVSSARQHLIYMSVCSFPPPYFSAVHKVNIKSSHLSYSFLWKKHKDQTSKNLPVNVWKQCSLKVSDSSISIPDELGTGEILDAIAWTLMEIVQETIRIYSQSKNANDG